MSIVLHADDFGMNEAVNAGILEAFEHGLLTSTAMLANAPASARAAADWKQLVPRPADRPRPTPPLRAGIDDARIPWDLGVHLNLTQGRPLTGERYPAALLDAEGRFPGIVRLFARLRGGGEKFRNALRAELAAQIAYLKDHGLRPTHVNGHQYVELVPAVAQLLPELLQRFEISVVRVASEPALLATTLLRSPRPAAWFVALVKRRYAQRLRASLAGRAVAAPRRFFGTAHAGRIDARVMSVFLASAGGAGLTEIALHPGLSNETADAVAAADGWSDPLARARPRELALLKSPLLGDLLRQRGAQLGRLAQLSSYREPPREATRRSWLFLKRAS